MSVLDPRKLLTLPHLLSPQTTDGLPRIWYVSAAGNDNNHGPGGAFRSNPILTIGRAEDSVIDNRGDIIAVGPGTYAEVLNVQKRKLSLIGLAPHPALVAITGSATQTAATITVADGYGNGFVLENLSVAAQAARAVVELETSDGGDMTATASDYHFTLRNVHLDGADTGTAALLLRGATSVRAFDSTFSGATYGIVLTGSLINQPTDALIEGCTFFDNVTWDVGTATTVTAGGASITAGALGSLDHLTYRKCTFADRGGTPVTNYVNIGAATTSINVGFYECEFARDIANGTLIATLPTNVVFVRCFSPAGAESFVG